MSAAEGPWGERPVPAGRDSGAGMADVDELPPLVGALGTRPLTPG
jgi:hypothetical protein